MFRVIDRINRGDPSWESRSHRWPGDRDGRVADLGFFEMAAAGA